MINGYDDDVDDRIFCDIADLIILLYQFPFFAGQRVF